MAEPELLLLDDLPGFFGSADRHPDFRAATAGIIKTCNAQ